VDDTGVPLEHLVSCLPGIDIYQGVGCVNYLRWLKNKGNNDVPLEGELQLLHYLD
jgi:meiosis arrest female protein 1